MGIWKSDGERGSAGVWRVKTGVQIAPFRLKASAEEKWNNQLYLDDRVFFNVQFYTKCAVLKKICAVLKKNLCSSKKFQKISKKINSFYMLFSNNKLRQIGVLSRPKPYFPSRQRCQSSTEGA